MEIDQQAPKGFFIKQLNTFVTVASREEFDAIIQIISEAQKK